MRNASRRCGRSRRRLLQRDLSPERPIAILSGNDIEHALLGLAAMHVGIPYAPISVPYSLLSQDFGKLKAIMRHCSRPAWSLPPTARRSRAPSPPPCRPTSKSSSPLIRRTTGATTPFAELLSRAADARGRRGACARSAPTRSRKFSSPPARPAMPKGVINTQLMLCANQAMIRAGLAFRRRRAAGHRRLAAVEPHLRQQPQFRPGARQRRLALYRRGQAAAGRHRRDACATCATSRRPSISTCRRASRCCCRISRRSRPCARSSSAGSKCMFYAGAGLSQHVLDAFQRLAVETTGERIIFLSSLGSTETAPAALACSWESERAGNIGLPLPGVELKARAARRQVRSAAERRQYHARLLARAATHRRRVRRGRLLQDRRRAEIRGSGRSRPRDCCSTDGSPRISSSRPAPGSASGRCAPPSSRISRRWCATSCSRAPTATHVAALVFPDLDACRELAPGHRRRDARRSAARRSARGARVRAAAQFARRAQRPARRTASTRAILLAEPPSLDIGEMTDKGSINQRAVLAHRARIGRRALCRRAAASRHRRRTRHKTR